MGSLELIELAQEALRLTLTLAVLPVFAIWLAGLLSGIAQRLLQVQDPVLSFVPKVAGLAAVWQAWEVGMVDRLVHFAGGLLAAAGH